MQEKKTKKAQTFTCHHGKGKVEEETNKCSLRKKGNNCPAGHPCKRT
jgi:hypothetical protein